MRRPGDKQEDQFQSPAEASLRLRGSRTVLPRGSLEFTCLGEGMPRGARLETRGHTSGCSLLCMLWSLGLLLGSWREEKAWRASQGSGLQQLCCPGEPGRKVERSELSLESSESGSGLGWDSGGIGWKRRTPFGLLMEKSGWDASKYQLMPPP